MKKENKMGKNEKKEGGERLINYGNLIEGKWKDEVGGENIKIKNN